MNTNIFSWHGLYEAAMLELDSAALRSRIAIARSGIAQRMQELSSVDSAMSGQERQAITDALNNLQALERVEFKASRPGENETPARVNSGTTVGSAL